MKQTLKYLIAVILFTGMLGAVHRVVSEAPEAAATVSVPAADTGSLVEKGADYILSIPDEMLLPGSSLSGGQLRENRAEQTLPRHFAPDDRYATRQPSRDYRNNYARIESEQQSLLPFIDPTLEYVFLLRRILI